MKSIKLLFAFLVFAGVASCSSDDSGNSNEPPANDPIIGKWNIQQELVNGEEVPLSDCERQSTVEFMTNGDVTTTEFFEDDANDCETYVYTDQWQNRGNNIYRITDGEESVDLPVIFSNNNNTFQVLLEDDEGSFYTTFVRI